VKAPQYNLTTCKPVVVKKLCERFHGYGGAGNSFTYAFAVWEMGEPVAAYAWQPPAPGAAASVAPEEPSAVLMLSRMVATPKETRALNHVAKPLRRQMKLIDRTRWPALVTYSDLGQGHLGHVYKCSGWEKVGEPERRPVFELADGTRVSSYSNGKHDTSEIIRKGHTFVQRWEHWITPRGTAGIWLAIHGWRRVPVPGKVWRSGNQAHTWERAA